MHKPAFLIGTVPIQSPLLLAPMAGYTESSFRMLCRDYGAAMTFTEVVNAMGLTYNSGPTWDLLVSEPEERPLAGHIYGNDPAVMADAAVRIVAEGRFDTIDINCGCPVRKIVRNGCGAALMDDPPLIGRIVKAIVAAVPVPVTVKTRIGPREREENIETVGAIVEDNGGAAITVHGRVASHHHKGEVDWERIAQLKQHLGIPVIGNGGLFSAEEVVRCVRSYGLDGVMIARGAVGNPWLFRDALALLAGNEPKPLSRQEFRDTIERHLRGVVAFMERRSRRPRRSEVLSIEELSVRHFRSTLFQYLRGLRDWHDVRQTLFQLTTIEGVLETVDVVLERQDEPITRKPRVNGKVGG